MSLTDQEILNPHLEKKDATFKKLTDSINSVSAKAKASCPEEWALVNSLVESLKPLVGQVTELKGIVATSDGITALRKAIEKSHMNFKGTATSRTGSRTKFGQQLENIRIAALNVQPLVPDEGDATTFKLIETLALIAEKTPTTAA